MEDASKTKTAIGVHEIVGGIMFVVMMLLIGLTRWNALIGDFGLQQKAMALTPFVLAVVGIGRLVYVLRRKRPRIT